MNQQHFLSPDVHVCVTADQVVFLDIADGRYLGLPIERACTLRPLIHGWPVGDDCSPDGPGIDNTLIRSLAKRGLITRDAARGKAATPVVVDLQNAWHSDRWLRHAPIVRTRHVLQFVTAVTYASCALRWMKLSRIVNRIRQRKLKSAGTPVDEDQLTQLMGIYGRLRPLLYTRKDACLLHALSVLEFLAHYRIFPDLVIGVRTRPFRAHCWLQHNGLALTDTPLHLSRLTPIVLI